ADLPVVLVGDIERGGVLASLTGTVALLEAGERARLCGYVVNKFRGDPRLFDSAIDLLRARTGLDCLGVVPFFAAARDLPAEDSVALDSAYSALAARTSDGRAPPLRIVVPRLPRIANFVLLPGSKATLADLAALRAEGWDIDILAHARRGGAVLGLCAGYQMLGRRIADPEGTEGIAGAAPGLGLIEVETVLAGEKILEEARGVEIASGAPVNGYEMHIGRTDGPGTARAMLRLGARTDGAVSPDGRIAGCHLHGLFAGDAFRRAFLARLGGAGDASLVYERRVEATLDALAAHLEASLDVDRL